MHNTNYIMDRIERTEILTEHGANRTVRLSVADMHIQTSLLEAAAEFGGFHTMSGTAKLEMKLSMLRVELTEAVLMKAYGSDWERHQ